MREKLQSLDTEKTAKSVFDLKFFKFQIRES